MKGRVERQKAIIDLIKEKAISSQSELVVELRKKGFKVQQPTISRDIKELGLVKIPYGETYKYVLPEEATPQAYPSRIATIAALIKTVEASGNLLVVKTEPGAASTVAVTIDKLNVPGILGTVAGDDTLVAVVDEKKQAKRVQKDLLKALKRS